jgi:uncharacterized protein YbjT (DUF2867 family)
VRVVLFGATGMVGQGVLRECLLDPGVEAVLAVTRTPLAQKHDKLREIVHKDFTDFSGVAEQLTGWDACFFCLGISSVGMKEADYRRITYDFTMAAASVLSASNPGMTFVFVSGASTDSSEKGPSMWARVKGQTENALMRLPFKASYMFRPGYIQPLHGVTSKTWLYRLFYALFAPLYPLLRRLAPRYVTSTEAIGRAMLRVAREGTDKRVLENADIDRLGATRAAIT